MKSYKVKGYSGTGLNINNSIEGESIERSLERIIENKEPIDNSRGLIYTERNSYRDWETDRKSTRLNSSHRSLSRMPSSA